MNPLMRTAFAAVITCVAACGNAAEQATTQPKGPYSGTVDAVVSTGGGAAGKAESGTATATFIPTRTGERLEVKASIRRANDSGFVVEGRSGGGGWQGRGGPLSLVVDRNGRISGGGIEKGHRITFTGHADARRMDLTVETLKLEPRGERIVFDYRLTSRVASSRAGGVEATSVPAQGRDNNKGACKRRVWKTRNVASPGGGMVMTQVPHCVD